MEAPTLNWDALAQSGISGALSALGARAASQVPNASPAPGPGTAPAGAPIILAPQVESFSMKPYLIAAGVIAALVAVVVIVRK